MIEYPILMWPKSGESSRVQVSALQVDSRLYPYLFTRVLRCLRLELLEETFFWF